MEARCLKLRRMKKKEMRRNGLGCPRSQPPLYIAPLGMDNEGYLPSKSVPNLTPGNQQLRFTIEVNWRALTSRYPSCQAPTVNYGATARASVKVKLAVGTATCVLRKLRRLTCVDWLTLSGLRPLVDTDRCTPANSRRVACADWITPTGLYRLAHFD
jgi:hypothetical protein